MSLFTVRVEIIHQADAPASARIEAKLDAILANQERQMAAIDDLTAAVQAADTVIDGAVALLEGILSRLDQAGTDPAKLDALRTDIEARTQKLAAAVAAVPPAPAQP